MKTLEYTSSISSPQKSTPEEYDLVILGGGTGGTIAAWTFAGQGQRVAVIERKYVGGSCQNMRYGRNYRCLDFCRARPACRGDRTKVRRRVMPKHCLHA